MSLFEHEACFFRDEIEDDEQFYEDSLSKDLFKKFELLTPPQSPPYDPFPPDLHGTAFDVNLQLVSQKLDTESLVVGGLQDENSISLASKLIQDCMWSGPCLAAAGLISSDTIKPKCQALAKDLFPDGGRRESASSSAAASSGACPEIQSGQCVDPAAVFPYQAETVKRLESTSLNLGSVAETPSPSESEDEEEIDVVTVVAEKMARRRQNQSSHRVSSSLHSHLAAIHNYSNTSSPPASYSAPQSPQTIRNRDIQHSYASHKRQRPVSMPPSPQPIKKQRSLLHSTDLKRVVQKLRMGHNMSSTIHIRTQVSRNSSDSEGDDTNKRAQHNVLERKRRNDLKYSFLRLRDHVPELSKQERTPKVTILKLSSDYIRSLTAQNKKLESERSKLKARHEMLRQKLAALGQDCW